MSWIDDNKGQGPWTFIPQPNKWGYLNNPRFADPATSGVTYTGDETNEPQVWSTSQVKGSTGDQIAHIPCGHWHKLPMDGGPGQSRGHAVGSIGYTTQQMSLNGTQSFTFIDKDGVVWTTLPEGYEWQVISGGGTITDTGVYTAPSSNAGCALNPNIGVIQALRVLASIEIAVNNPTETGIAGYYTDTYAAEPEYGYCGSYIRIRNMTCVGGLASSAWSPGCQGVDCGSSICRILGCSIGNPNWSVSVAIAYCLAGSCISGAPGTNCNMGGHDTRTAGQIANGCCPYQLL